MQNIQLYHYWRSSCSWRVRWALKHKGIAYQDKPINLLLNEQNSPVFLAVNPSGFLPALAVDGTVMSQSLAILEWLEETHPHRPLLPASAADRAIVRQICLMVVADTQPLQNLSVMRHHSSDPTEQSKWSRHWIEKGLVKLEAVVAKHAGTYCVGGQLTLADLCLVPQMYNALRFQIDVAQFPTLSRIHQHCMTIPECVAAAPEKQPGAQ